MTEEHSKMEINLIIDRPTLVSKTRHYTEWSLQVLGWILWVFFIHPLIMIILWYVAFRFFNYQMFKLGGISNPKYFSAGAGVLLIIYAGMLIWSKYNAYRFRGKEKRRSSGTATPEKMAAYYKVKPENIIDLQNSRNVDVYFPEGDIVEISSDKASRFRALYAPQNKEKHHDGNITA